jgi:hypothetical protein
MFYHVQDKVKQAQGTRVAPNTTAEIDPIQQQRWTKYNSRGGAEREHGWTKYNTVDRQ